MLCPVCNGIHVLKIECPACDGMMTDDGRVQDEWGPYAPYQPIDNEAGHLSNSHNKTYCQHQCHCKKCGNVTEIMVAGRESYGI